MSNNRLADRRHKRSIPVDPSRIHPGPYDRSEGSAPEIVTATTNQDSTHRQLPLPLWRRIAYLALALAFFVFAIVGVVLPGIPTTPFLLLTSYFLVRCSPRLNALLLRSRFFGSILRDWQERGGIRRDVKIQAIVVVTLVLAATTLFSPLAPLPLCVVTSLALIGVLVILRLPEPR